MKSTDTLTEAARASIRLWMQVHWLAFKDTFVLVYLRADTTILRIALAWSSFAAAVNLAIDPNKFDMPAYAVVRVFGTEWMWVCYFLLHFFGVHWRVFERTKVRVRWSYAVNSLGFLVWFLPSAGVSLSTGAMGIPTSIGVVMSVFAAYAAYRTGLEREVVSP